MAFTLPPLPYDYNALEPHIDETTMRIHHDKHHGTYVTNLNTALESQASLQSQSIEDLLGNLNAVPEAIRTAVRNNGGGHYNHTLFWELMAPGGAKEPAGTLAKEIDGAFGSLATFKEQFQKAGLGRFGSGWAWLVQDKSGKLAIESTPNQDSPIMDGKRVVLGCDVWEHAYYLKYQNRRADYLGAWWNVLNWTVVGRRFNG
jgi:Fe-Mn family superoxide dismutase